MSSEVAWVLSVAAAAALMLVVVTAVFVATGFTLALKVFQSPQGDAARQPLPRRLIDLARGIVVEWLVTMYVALLVPLRGIRSRSALPTTGHQRLLALLPGYLENAATMAVMRRRLERALGIPVRTLTPLRYFTSIEALAQDYRRQITNWLSESGARQIDLVGHSMGGLIARVLVEQLGLAGTVGYLVTVGAPHLGTALAPFGMGKNARQMSRKSAFLQELNARSVPPGVCYIGICSAHDNVVLPWRSALSPRGDNFTLRFRGHLTLIFSQVVVELIAEKLAGHGASAQTTQPRAEC
jgi:triacylglycerol esterase/lipase EstA (alpha/beta hydrolase family)